MPEIKDYTRCDEGLYRVTVQSHTFSSPDIDPVLILRIKPIEVERDGKGWEPFHYSQKYLPEARFAVTAEKAWMVKRLLRDLGNIEFAELVSASVDQDGNAKDAFTLKGKPLTLECKHFTNEKRGTKSEYWGFPRSGGSKPLAKDAVSKMLSVMADMDESKDDPAVNDHGVAMQDDLIPF